LPSRGVEALRIDLQRLGAPGDFDQDADSISYNLVNDAVEAGESALFDLDSVANAETIRVRLVFHRCSVVDPATGQCCTEFTNAYLRDFGSPEIQRFQVAETFENFKNPCVGDVGSR
jgi:hypothetical protein